MRYYIREETHYLSDGLLKIYGSVRELHSGEIPEENKNPIPCPECGEPLYYCITAIGNRTKHEMAWRHADTSNNCKYKIVVETVKIKNDFERMLELAERV